VSGSVLDTPAAMQVVMVVVCAIGALLALWSLVGYGRLYERIGRSLDLPIRAARLARRASKRSEQFQALEKALATKSVSEHDASDPGCQAVRGARR
jgi:hypothetical protein